MKDSRAESGGISPSSNKELEVILVVTVVTVHCWSGILFYGIVLIILAMIYILKFFNFERTTIHIKLHSCKYLAATLARAALASRTPGKSTKQAPLFKTFQGPATFTQRIKGQDCALKFGVRFLGCRRECATDFAVADQRHAAQRKVECRTFWEGNRCRMRWRGWWR